MFFQPRAQPTQSTTHFTKRVFDEFNLCHSMRSWKRSPLPSERFCWSHQKQLSRKNTEKRHLCHSKPKSRSVSVMEQNTSALPVFYRTSHANVVECTSVTPALSSTARKPIMKKSSRPLKFLRGPNTTGNPTRIKHVCTTLYL